MDKRVAALLGAAALFTAMPTKAATDLPAAAGQDWQHRETGLRLPDKLDGFTRTRVADFGKSQSDIMGQYHDDATGTTATVYFYRAGSPIVPVWADRAETSMQANAPVYGTFDTAGRRWSLATPWAKSPNSAIRIVYPLSGKGFTATGLMLAERDGWLIKIRMTSGGLTAAALEARITSLFAALKLPSPKVSSEPAYAVQPCATQLAFSDAKPVPRGKDDGVMAAAMMQAVAPLAAKEAKRTKPVTFCRNGAAQTGLAVYRPDESTERYLLALGDGGATVWAGRDGMAEALKKGEVRYSVSLHLSDKEYGFAPFQSLPTPQQATELATRGRPTYARSRIPGQEKEIQIFPD